MKSRRVCASVIPHSSLRVCCSRNKVEMNQLWRLDSSRSRTDEAFVVLVSQYRMKTGRIVCARAATQDFLTLDSGSETDVRQFHDADPTQCPEKLKFLWMRSPGLLKREWERFHPQTLMQYQNSISHPIYWSALGHLVMLHKPSDEIYCRPIKHGIWPHLIGW